MDFRLRGNDKLNELIMRWIKVIALLSLFLVSCGESVGNEVITAVSQPTTTRLTGGLAPTFTPIQPATPLPIKTAVFNSSPDETAVLPTLPPDQILVNLRYALPEIGLDRSLQGNAAGHIVIRDNVTEASAESANLDNIIAEMVHVLPETELEPLSEPCPTCLFLSYELPLTGETGEGWLHDQRLAASLENYISIALGPHFPPDTIIGIRRSASSYAPAHSLALTANGRLFQWTAIDDSVAEDEGNTFAPAELQAALNRLPLDRLQDSYAVDCTLSPNELLYLRAGEASRAVQIVCPEFALPDMLIPLYSQLDTLMAENLGEEATPPPAAFPLNGVIDYQRADDGARLTILMDGTAVISTSTLTDTLSATSTVPTADWRRLQLDLLDSGLLATGLLTFQVDPAEETAVAPSRLLVRGEEGVYDAAWQELPETSAFTTLNDLLDSFLPQEE